MLRTTRHSTVHIPHGVALAAAILALAAWGMNSHTIHTSANAVAAQQEEVANTAVQEGSRALLDIGVLLLVRNNSR